MDSSAEASGRVFAAAAFAALLIAAVALNSFRIGWVPIRGFATLGALALALLFYFPVAKRVFAEYRLLLALAAGLAVLGVFVSLVNGASPAGVFRQVAEVHVQAAATILAAAILARVAGARASTLAIVAVISASAFVAMGQMLDIQPAWALRRALGPLPTEEIEGLNFLERRPVGLSFSPITLSTHLCLGFATFLAVRSKLRGPASGADPLVVPALLAFFAACIACATRSPILGGLIFLAVYAIQQRTSWMPIFLVVAAAIAYFVWPLLTSVFETAAPRLLETDDNSAKARSTLVYYGLRLFADNPLGYGLTFAPMTLWQGYWPDLYMMQSPQGTRENDLHNYLVTMINVYGVGLLLLTPIVARLIWQIRASLIFFIPYMVHIFFHNSGPFHTDNVIWFAIAAIAAAEPVRLEQPAGAGGRIARRTMPRRMSPVRGRFG
ncbi:O-antigen ligase family protein [Sphingomonas sp. GCM10030256]|uniref:O-antigen ligase family protein n=1 Tax=Sphingomonas sp. GCM10030256 TaxID=3273427 RepID=UPI00362295C1